MWPQCYTGSGLTSRSVKKYSGNVLSEHNADSVAHCDSIYVMNVHVTSYIHELRVIIRSSVTDTAKTSPSIPPPTRDSFVHLLVFWWWTRSAAEVSRCAPGISQTLPLCCGTPAACRDERRLSNAVCCCCCCLVCLDQSWVEQWPEEASFCLITGVNIEKDVLFTSINTAFKDA